MLTQAQLEERLDTTRITEWHSIITLIIFVLTSKSPIRIYQVPGPLRYIAS